MNAAIDSFHKCDAAKAGDFVTAKRALRGKPLKGLMLKGLMVTAAALAVAGCTSSEAVPGPDGQSAILIDCSDAFSYGDCYREAEEQCPAGYELLPPPAVSSTNSQTVILVRCKDEDAS